MINFGSTHSTGNDLVFLSLWALGQHTTLHSSICTAHCLYPFTFYILILISLSTYQRVVWLDHVVVLSLVFWGPSIPISILAILFTFLPILGRIHSIFIFLMRAILTEVRWKFSVAKPQISKGHETQNNSGYKINPLHITCLLLCNSITTKSAFNMRHLLSLSFHRIDIRALSRGPFTFKSYRVAVLVWLGKHFPVRPLPGEGSTSGSCVCNALQTIIFASGWLVGKGNL